VGEDREKGEMTILGIGGILSDPSVAVVRDGRIAAAIEQKKLLRSARLGELPEAAIREALAISGGRPEKVECVVVVRPVGAALESALHGALRYILPHAQAIVVDHHTAHAASAFFTSGFEEAKILTLDRAGDLRCGAMWRGAGSQIQLERELYFPDSLGDLYGRVTALLGYQPRADEHKVQWLSTLGSSRFTPLFREIIGGEGGWPRFDATYFDAERHGDGDFSAKLYERLGVEDGAALPEPVKADVARGIQEAVEQAVVEMAGSGENLALAGGLALNALLVRAVERSGRWRNVYVQPAAGNAGTAVGAALHGWHHHFKQAQRAPGGNLLFGPAYSPEEIKQVLENCKLGFRYLLTTGELIERAVEELNANKIIAWMQGRMEFGPRALGNRSILASPLNPYSTENLNTFIKHREVYRKFAASVPAELANHYFEAGPNARFLASVSRIRAEHKETFGPAIMGDGMIRVHAVHKEDNPLYWELLHAFGKSTGLPVLFNTSFNLFGDPLVCSPRDAVRSFYSSGIDSMFVGPFQLQK
jgi:carbamoyltransferase